MTLLRDTEGPPAPVAPFCLSSRVQLLWPQLSARWLAGPYQEGILELCQLPLLWELEWPSQGTVGSQSFLTGTKVEMTGI